MLRDDPGVRKNRHEVSVTGPAWHDMHVDVFRNSGPCNLTEIPADIEALGSAGVAQNSLTANRRNASRGRPGRGQGK